MTLMQKLKLLWDENQFFLFQNEKSGLELVKY